MPDLQKLTVKLGTDGPVMTLPTSRQISLVLNGVCILRTDYAVLVWEHKYYPWLYIPHMEFKAFRDSRLEISEGEKYKDSDGNVMGTQFILTVGERTIKDNILFAYALPAAARELRSLVRVDFASVDQWFEEDSPILIHPKDPFKRIDILPSSRPITVRVGGQVVAEATSSLHLHETGLPARYYLLPAAVDKSVLRPSSTKTKCPYKGEAEYFSVEVGGKLYEDVIWYYRKPIDECAKIEDYYCFYNEKVEIQLDHKVLEAPVTHLGQGKPGEFLPSALTSFH